MVTNQTSSNVNNESSPTFSITSIPPPVPPVKSKIFFIIIGIGLIVMVGAGSLILGKYLYSPKISLTPSISIISPTSTASLTPVLNTELSPGSTENWKTYSSKDHNFSFHYPPQWIISDDDIEPNRIVGLWPERINGEVPGIFINYYNIAQDVAIKDWWETHISGYGNYEYWLNQTNREIAMLNNHQAYRVQTAEEKGWYSRPFTSLYVKNGDKIYEISTGIHKESDIYSIYEQVLSTFIFLNNQKLSVRIYTHGGLCPNGVECSNIKTIDENGYISFDQGTVGKINKEELLKLKNTIDNTDFAQIKSKKYTGICPTSYDGVEVIYTFNTDKVEESISSCITEIDPNTEPFLSLENILKRFRT